MFFVLSKTLWFVLAPFNLAVFALTGAMIAMRYRQNRLARHLGIMAWAVLVVFGVLPTGQLLTGFLESRYHAPAPMPRPVAGIIVLGGGIDSDIGLDRGVPQLNASGDRLNAFVDLARQYPWARLVYTSGLGTLGQKGTPEAQMAKQALTTYGINPGRRLILEDKARTTYENAVLSHDLVKPKPGQNWLLVTSAWHMPRAMGVFRKAGWTVIPYPADYLTSGKTHSAGNQGFIANMQISHVALKEMLGIGAYALSGKWAGPEKEAGADDAVKDTGDADKP